MRASRDAVIVDSAACPITQPPPWIQMSTGQPPARGLAGGSDDLAGDTGDLPLDHGRLFGGFPLEQGHRGEGLAGLGRGHLLERRLSLRGEEVQELLGGGIGRHGADLTSASDVRVILRRIEGNRVSVSTMSWHE